MATTLTIKTKDPGETPPTVSIYSVDVTAFSQEAIYDEDGRTPMGQKIVASGTGLVHIADAYATLKANLIKTNNRVREVRLTSATKDVLLLTDREHPLAGGMADDRGGPFVKLNVTEISGTLTAMVTWEVTGTVSQVEDQTVVSHRWTQSININESGIVRRTTNGSLRVAPSTTGNKEDLALEADWVGRVPYADLFRRVIVPELLDEYGWRRESQDYAMDVTGTSLVYQVVDKRLAHDLPDGVRVGDMSFTYERAYLLTGTASLHFSCTLEGDLGMNLMTLQGISGPTPNVPGNRALVAIATQLARTRINSSFKDIIIQKVRVKEEDILSTYKISFDLYAMGIPTNTTGEGGEPAPSAMVPLSWMIGKHFKVVRSTNRQIDAYGVAVSDQGAEPEFWISRMDPHWLANNINGIIKESGTPSSFPSSTLIQIGVSQGNYGTVAITISENSTGGSDINDIFEGAFQGDVVVAAKDGDGFTTAFGRTSAVSNISVQSGLARLSPMYTDATDVVYQTSKPIVFVTEEVEVSRTNQAPSKAFRPLPAGAWLVDEGWKVSHGSYDPQGQRVFSGIYQRTIGMYDNGSNGFTTTTPSGFGKALRVWGAPNQTVLATLSPAITSDAQQSSDSTFAIAADVRQAYPTPNPTFAS